MCNGMINSVVEWISKPMQYNYQCPNPYLSGMKTILRLAIAGLMFAALPVSNLLAQAPSNYDQHELFSPYFFRYDGNDYRSASGQPGPKYWQNRADYLIRATLNEQDTAINGEVTINYTNNSPDKLDFLWLQLDQNLFRPDSRGAATTPVSGDRFDVKGFSKGGYHIESVEIVYGEKTYAVAPIISDARMHGEVEDACKGPVATRSGSG